MDSALKKLLTLHSQPLLGTPLSALAHVGKNKTEPPAKVARTARSLGKTPAPLAQAVPAGAALAVFLVVYHACQLASDENK